MKYPILLFLLPWFLQAQTPRLMVPVAHTQVVKSVAFSPNGKTVLTGSKDNTGKLRHLNGREIQSIPAAQRKAGKNT
ncbi:MAG TPA: hypothetical protein DCF33_20625 [Saprospirales bacterium]|nr:hypothetical protein [Saprospirales bacterium]